MALLWKNKLACPFEDCQPESNVSHGDLPDQAYLLHHSDSFNNLNQTRNVRSDFLKDINGLSSWMYVNLMFGHAHYALEFHKLKPLWPESASKLYQPSDSRFSAKFVSTFAERGVSCSQHSGSSTTVISIFSTGAATFSFSSSSIVLTRLGYKLNFTQGPEWTGLSGYIRFGSECNAGWRKRCWNQWRYQCYGWRCFKLEKWHC
jgi:hypothetical protein